jgi:hypothetical protein
MGDADFNEQHDYGCENKGQPRSGSSGPNYNDNEKRRRGARPDVCQ